MCLKNKRWKIVFTFYYNQFPYKISLNQSFKWPTINTKSKIYHKIRFEFRPPNSKGQNCNQSSCLNNSPCSLVVGQGVTSSILIESRGKEIKLVIENLFKSSNIQNTYQHKCTVVKTPGRGVVDFFKPILLRGYLGWLENLYYLFMTKFFEIF